MSDGGHGERSRRTPVVWRPSSHQMKAVDRFLLRDATHEGCGRGKSLDGVVKKGDLKKGTSWKCSIAGGGRGRGECLVGVVEENKTGTTRQGRSWCDAEERKEEHKKGSEKKKGHVLEASEPSSFRGKGEERRGSKAGHVKDNKLTDKEGASKEAQPCLMCEEKRSLCEEAGVSGVGVLKCEERWLPPKELLVNIAGGGDSSNEREGCLMISEFFIRRFLKKTLRGCPCVAMSNTVGSSFSSNLLSVVSLLQNVLVLFIQGDGCMGCGCAEFLYSISPVKKSWEKHDTQMRSRLASLCCQKRSEQFHDHSFSSEQVFELCCIFLMGMMTHEFNLVVPCCGLQRVTAPFLPTVGYFITEMLRGLCQGLSSRLFLLEALGHVVQCFVEALQDSVEKLQDASWTPERVETLVCCTERALEHAMQFLRGGLNEFNVASHVGWTCETGPDLQGPDCLYCQGQWWCQGRSRNPLKRVQHDLPGHLDAVIQALLTALHTSLSAQAKRHLIGVYISQLHWMLLLSVVGKSSETFSLVWGFTFWCLGGLYNEALHIKDVPYQCRVYWFSQLLVRHCQDLWKVCGELPASHAPQCVLFLHLHKVKTSSSLPQCWRQWELFFSRFSSSQLLGNCSLHDAFAVALQLMACLQYLVQCCCGCETPHHHSWTMATPTPYLKGKKPAPSTPSPFFKLNFTWVMLILSVWSILYVLSVPPHAPLLFSSVASSFPPTFDKIALQFLYQFVLHHARLMLNIFPWLDLDKLNASLVLLAAQVSVHGSFHIVPDFSNNLHGTFSLGCSSCVPCHRVPLGALLQKHCQQCLSPVTLSMASKNGDLTTLQFKNVDLDTPCHFKSIQWLDRWNQVCKDERSIYSSLTFCAVYVIMKTLTCEPLSLHPCKVEGINGLRSVWNEEESRTQAENSFGFEMNVLECFSHVTQSLFSSHLGCEENRNPQGSRTKTFEEVNTCGASDVEGSVSSQEGVWTCEWPSGQLGKHVEGIKTRGATPFISVCSCTVWLWAFCALKYGKKLTSHDLTSHMAWDYRETSGEEKKRDTSGLQEKRPTKKGVSPLIPEKVALHCVEFLCQSPWTVSCLLATTGVSLQWMFCAACPFNALFEAYGVLALPPKTSGGQASWPPIMLNPLENHLGLCRVLAYFEALCCVSRGLCGLIPGPRFFYSLDVTMRNGPSKTTLAVVLIKHIHAHPDPRALWLFNGLPPRHLGALVLQLLARVLNKPSRIIRESHEPSLLFFRTLLLELGTGWLSLGRCFPKDERGHGQLSVLLSRIMELFLFRLHKMVIAYQEDSFETWSFSEEKNHQGETQECTTSAMETPLEYWETDDALVSTASVAATPEWPQTRWSVMSALAFLVTVTFYYPSGLRCNPEAFWSKMCLLFFSPPTPLRSPLFPSKTKRAPCTSKDPTWLRLARHRLQRCSSTASPHLLQLFFTRLEASITHSHVLKDIFVFTPCTTPVNSCHPKAFPDFSSHVVLSLVKFTIFYQDWPHLFTLLPRIFSRLAQLINEKTLLGARLVAYVIFDTLNWRLCFQPLHMKESAGVHQLLSTVSSALISLGDPLHVTQRGCSPRVSASPYSGSALLVKKKYQYLLASLDHVCAAVTQLFEWVHRSFAVFGNPSVAVRAHLAQVIHLFTLYGVTESPPSTVIHHQNLLFWTLHRKCTHMTPQDLLSRVLGYQKRIKHTFDPNKQVSFLHKKHDTPVDLKLTVSPPKKHNNHTHVSKHSSPFPSQTLPKAERLTPRRRIHPQLITFPAPQKEEEEEEKTYPQAFQSYHNAFPIKKEPHQQNSYDWILFTHDDLPCVPKLDTTQTTTSMEQTLNQCQLDPYWTIYIADMFCSSSHLAESWRDV